MITTAGKTRSKFTSHIFITGIPRSGTTMLNLLLCQGDCHRFFPECNLITNIFEIAERRRYVDDGRYSAYIGDEISAQALYSRFVRIYSDHLLRDEPFRRYLCLKDPYMLNSIDSVLKFFPTSPVFVMYRHPLQVVSSLKTVIEKRGTDFDLETTCEGLRKSLATIYRIAQENHPNVFVIDYDDFLSDVDGSVKILSKLLGYDIANLPSHVEFDPGNPFYSNLYGNKITSDNIKRDTSNISANEALEISRVLSPFISGPASILALPNRII